jgi:outer membrane protein, heavy metal efflux system
MSLARVVSASAVALGLSAFPQRARAQGSPAWPAQRTVELSRLPGTRAEHLAELTADAWRHHPAIQQAKHALAAARERPSRVGALPDPVLGVALQNIRTDEPALDTSAMSAVQLSLTQAFPFPGKLGRRQEVAEARAGTAERRLGLVRAEVVLRVERAYWRLQFAETAERITADSEGVLNTLAQSVAAHYTVGHTAQQDLLQANVEHSRLRAMLEQRRLAVSAARRALNGAVGRAPRADIATADRPATGSVRLDRATLMREVENNDPALGVRRAEIETARREVDEARQDRWPDFQIGVQYRFREATPGDPSRGADMFGVSLAIPLPVWMGAKQNAKVRQSYDELGAARDGLNDDRLDAVTRFGELADDVDRLNTEIALYQREILPETKQTVTASINDYEVGRVGMVSVLDNWQTDLKAQIAYARLLSERAVAVAEIDALAGRTP